MLEQIFTEGHQTCVKLATKHGSSLFCLVALPKMGSLLMGTAPTKI